MVGRILDIDLTITAYRDQHGNPIGIATTEREVTERKQAAVALQQLNSTLEQRVTEQTQQVKLLAEAISHLGDGVMITSGTLDLPGPQILFANEALCQMTGYQMSELLGQTPRMFQGAQTSRAVLDHLKQELSAGRECQTELVNYRKDGTPFDVELYLTPIRDADGRIANYVSINRDITERKQYEEQLRFNEDRFRQIFENAAVGIAYGDREGKFVLCNATFQAITGYSQAELLQLSFNDLVHPADRDQNLLQVNRLISGEIPAFEIENRYVSKSGSEVWVNAFVSLLLRQA